MDDRGHFDLFCCLRSGQAGKTYPAASERRRQTDEKGA